VRETGQFDGIMTKMKRRTATPHLVMGFFLAILPLIMSHSMLISIKRTLKGNE
jgi:hypothetical protein